MKTVYLIYRPVMDYEESMSPHFIFTTRAKADAALKRIRDWGAKAVAAMPDWPDDAEEKSPEWCAAWDAREAYVNSLKDKAPFGLDFCHSDIGVYTSSFNPGCVDVMEIAANPVTA